MCFVAWFVLQFLYLHRHEPSETVIQKAYFCCNSKMHLSNVIKCKHSIRWMCWSVMQWYICLDWKTNCWKILQYRSCTDKLLWQFSISKKCSMKVHLNNRSVNRVIWVFAIQEDMLNVVVFTCDRIWLKKLFKERWWQVKCYFFDVFSIFWSTAENCFFSAFSIEHLKHFITYLLKVFIMCWRM